MVISFSETRRNYYRYIKVGKIIIFHDNYAHFFDSFGFVKRKGYAETLPNRIRIDHTWKWNWIKFIYYTKIV